jgi:circadian clock protein KaiB
MLLFGEASPHRTRLCNIEQHQWRQRVRISPELAALSRQSALGGRDQILDVPTLVRRLREPVKKVIGDLSNRERSLVGGSPCTVTKQ